MVVISRDVSSSLDDKNLCIQIINCKNLMVKNFDYITNNYVLKPIYSDENECINDILSLREPKSNKKRKKWILLYIKFRGSLGLVV